MDREKGCENQENLSNFARGRYFWEMREQLSFSS